MSTLFVFNAPFSGGYQVIEDAPLQPNEVRLRTLFSGISAGTELTYWRGTNPYLTRRWDADRRLFVDDAAPTFGYPVLNLGYEEVGEVIEVGSGVTDIPVGAHLFGTWGHRTHHVAPVDYVRPRLMPPGLDPLCGIFSHLGAIALNGVHDAAISLGDTVAIFGMGALGQIVTQMAKRSGAKVIAVDLLDSRLEMAQRSGADITLNAGEGSTAERIKALTNNMGADVCIEVSGSTLALNEAIRAAAYSARVVAMGFFQGEAKGLTLGAEFHHNRINLVCSQISGVSPEHSYRWTKLRLWQTAIRLQAEGVLDLRSLVTHRAPFEQAESLYRLIDERPNEVLLGVLEFGGA
ncbi:MAG: zinc-binding dehydrogenase [Anaerolinea sp.]|nr:zinc-binding dehydrogenase [Anaerolinea sp.]